MLALNLFTGELCLLNRYCLHHGTAEFTHTRVSVWKAFHNDAMWLTAAFCFQILRRKWTFLQSNPEMIHTHIKWNKCERRRGDVQILIGLGRVKNESIKFFLQKLLLAVGLWRLAKYISKRPNIISCYLANKMWNYTLYCRRQDDGSVDLI